MSIVLPVLFAPGAAAVFNTNGGPGFTMNSGAASNTNYILISNDVFIGQCKGYLTCAFDWAVFDETGYSIPDGLPDKCRINVSVDGGTTWLYHNGSAWISTAENYSNTEDWDDVSALLDDLDIPSGKIRFKFWVTRPPQGNYVSLNSLILTATKSLPIIGMQRPDESRADMAKAVIESEGESGYKQKRRTRTGTLMRWNLQWNNLTLEEYLALREWFDLKLTDTAFNWQNPNDGLTYSVWFSEELIGQRALGAAPFMNATCALEEVAS
jgi:hypothetical protein